MFILDKKLIITEICKKFNNSLILISGSYIQGNFNEYSDIDLLIASPDVVISYNEKYYSKRLNCQLDCLVFPKNKISEEIIKSYNSKSGALIRMIALGYILTDEENLLFEMKKLCEYYFFRGKSYTMDEAEIKNNCIIISNSLDDLKVSETEIENFFIINRIINHLSKLYLTANNYWIPVGKVKVKVLKEICPDFVQDIIELSREAFSTNSVPEKLIKKLEYHLNKFKIIKNYSTRKSFIQKNKFSIELINVSISEYYIIIKNLTIQKFRKYNLYIKEISFEYNEITHKILIEIIIKEKSYISYIELYNNLTKDVFGKTSSYIFHNNIFNNYYGGKEMSKILSIFKNKISAHILNYAREDTKILESSNMFNIAFYLYLYFIKKENLSVIFSEYLYELWLPNAYDVKAFYSYEQLNFEKEKVINHYYLRFIRDQEKLENYIDYFFSHNEKDIQTSKIIEIIIYEFNILLKNFKSIRLDFFQTDIIIASKFTNKASLWVAYLRIVEILFNILGITQMDRAYIIYILKNTKNAK